MDKLKSLISQHYSKLKYLFLVGAAIAALNTIRRADYNFILYFYLLYVWQYLDNSSEYKNPEKSWCFFGLAYSFLIDIFWCFYWSIKWSNLPEDYQTMTQSLTLLLSWIGLAVKGIILGVICIAEMDVIKQELPAKLREKLNKQENLYPQVDEQPEGINY